MLGAFLGWTEQSGISLYEAQEEAILEIMGGTHLVLNNVQSEDNGTRYRVIIRNQKIPGGITSRKALLQVTALPTITSATTASAMMNQPFLYTIKATDDPTSFGASSLPDWLDFNATSGDLNGTPVAAGSYTLIISATNAEATDVATLRINVGEDRPGTAEAALSYVQNPAWAKGYVDPGLNNVVDEIVVQPDGKILARWRGDTISEQPWSSKPIIRLNEDGTHDTGFNPPNWDIYRMAVLPDGKILVAGYFNSGYYHYPPDGRNRYSHNLARLNANGGHDSSFHAGENWSQLKPHGMKVLADGHIIIYGPGSPYIMKRNASGHATGFSGGPGGAVYCMDLAENGQMYVGGDFSTYGGVNRQRFARINPDGSLDPTFPNISINNKVRVVWIRPDGKILIAGDFTNVGGQTRNSMALIHPDGTVDRTSTRISPAR